MAAEIAATVAVTNLLTDIFGVGGTDTSGSGSGTTTGESQGISGQLQQSQSATTGSGTSTNSTSGTSSQTGSSTTSQTGTSTNRGTSGSTSISSGKNNTTSESATTGKSTTSGRSASLDEEFLTALQGLTRQGTADLQNTKFTRDQAIADTQGMVQEVFRNYQEGDVAQILGQMGQSGAYNSSTAQLLQDNARAVATNKAAGLVLQNIKDYAQLGLAEQNAVTSLFSTLKGAETQSGSTTVSDSRTLGSSETLSSSTVNSQGTTSSNTTSTGGSTTSSSQSGSSSSASSGATSNNSVTDNLMLALGITSGAQQGTSTNTSTGGTQKAGWSFACSAATLAVGGRWDSIELRLLRRYRFGYLVRMPNGRALSSKYHREAPGVVALINSLPTASLIWRYVYARFVARAALYAAVFDYTAVTLVLGEEAKFLGKVCKLAVEADPTKAAFLQEFQHGNH